MNNLVIKHNETLVTTQNEISILTKNDENSIQKLIRTYKADLEEFGILQFENQLIINSKNVKNYKKIYYLNEQQATLLLTYMKNSESVRNAKKVLVFAFYQMKEKLKNLEQEQMQKLAFHQSLGYKSQLKQQKEKYENKIKALKYDLEKKKQLSFKRKLSEKELLELRKILAKDYDILCFKKWEYMLFAESVSGKNYKLEKENDFCIYKSIKDSFNSKLDYYKNYDEYEEKWKKILRR
ncbi:TPA: Rha family transcriptional regulator [Campylobacter jejuni]|nr:Rha family transcriptional regulator [Campylobacter jejuni]